jgi:hypothetical protein
MPTPDQVNKIKAIVSAQTVLRIRQIMAALIPPAARTEAEYIGQVEPLLNHIRMDTFNYYTATVWPDVQQHVFPTGTTHNILFSGVQYYVRTLFVKKVLAQLVPTMREEWRAENIVAVEGPAFVAAFRQFSLRK